MFKTRLKKSIHAPFGVLIATAALTGMAGAGPFSRVGAGVGLCFALCGIALSLALTKRFYLLQAILGAIVAMIAMLGLAEVFGFGTDSVRIGISSEAAAAFIAAGLILSFRNGSGKNSNILALQFLWLILFVISLSGCIGHLLNAMLGVILFKYGLLHYGMGWPTASGLMVLSLSMLSFLRKLPGFHAFYDGRQDRQITAQGIFLLICVGLISGLSGAGILAKENMRVFQKTLTEALLANSHHLSDSIRNTVDEDMHIVDLSNLGSMVVIDSKKTDHRHLSAELERIIDMQKRPGIEAIWVRDADGNTIASAGVRSSLSGDRIKLNLSIPTWLLWQSGLRLESHILLYRLGRKVGEIGVESDLNGLDSQFDLTRRFGTTGEVVLCSPEGAGMACFPSRLHPVMSLVKMRFSGQALPMSYALMGKGGVMTGRDYRGKEVIAAYKPVSDIGLGMVQKIDAGELYAPLWRQMLSAISIFILMSGMGAVLLFRKTQPLVRDLIVTKVHAQKSERHTRHLLENLQTAVVIHSADGSVSYLNTAAQRFFGFDVDEMRGMHVPDLIARFLREDGSAMPMEELPERRVLADGLPFQNYMVGVEFQGRAKLRWALVNAFPDFDENGTIREVVVSFVDISDLKFADEALREAEDKLQKINHLYLVLSKVNGAIVRTRNRNELFQDICDIVVKSGGFVMAWIGLLDDVAGEVVPVVHSGSEAGYLDFLRTAGIIGHKGPAALAVLEGKHQICQDIMNDPKMTPWKDEALKRGYCSSGGFPFHHGGRAIGLINLYADRVDFFSEDIVNLLHKLCADISFAIEYLDQQSRRGAAEEMLRQLNSDLEYRVERRTRQLEAANAELEAFSYSVSHDLRAPLRSIDGFSEILQKKYAAQLDDTARDYLGRVNRASKRMGELIEDLLQLSSVTRTQIRKDRIDLGRIVETVIKESGYAQAERHVDWVIQADITVFADARLMKIVLENLLGNAWKFTASCPDPRIEFGMFEQEDEKIMFVRDNGVGFDMKYAGKLFGAFQRLHRFDEFEGTGIGLATVQRIIHRQGGRVWAKGEVGVGATFYFSL